MPRFKYRIVEKDGRVVEGCAEASSLEALEREASLRGAVVVRAQAEREGRNALSGSESHKPKHACLGEFTSLLAALLESGLSVRDALDVVAGAAQRDDVVALAKSLAERVDAGKGLDGAFDDLGLELPPVYRGLVRIGERTGSVERVFPRLAVHLDTERKARERVLNAMIYPVTVLGLAIGGMAGLTFYILPKLATIFGELGGSSLAGLKVRIAVATSLTVSLLAIAVAAAVAAPFVAAARKSNPGFARRFDAILFKLPLVGKALLERETLSFTFAMESLVAGGLTVDDSLAEAARAAGNKAFAAEILAIQERLRKGLPLSSACGKCRYLPPYVRQWFVVGERTGQVEHVFSQLRGYYQNAADRTLERLMNMVEPAIILLVGLIVLGLVVFFVLPLFSAYGSLL